MTKNYDDLADWPENDMTLAARPVRNGQARR